jgi:hypothetical protein
MKKKIIMLAAAFVLVTNVIFANSDKARIPESVASAFTSTFAHVRDVRWENFGNYFKASFIQKGKTMYAFYSDNAEFMGVAKNILSDGLPGMLQAEIKSKYPGYWITDLAKYQVGDKNGFLITLENADKKIVLKTEDNQHWQIYTKAIKA